MKFLKSTQSKLLLCTSVLFLSFSSMADVAVVVNSTNADIIDDNDIARIFMGKMKAFPSGGSIEPINSVSGSAVRSEFEEKVLNKSSSQMKAYWSKLIFSGRGKPPTELASDAEVLKHISANAGAIGYVDAGSVDESVKVLKTF
ncbi:phosphate ABC transporter substrate-binding protein [Colwellia sp. 20A7]|uniref:phosphate ABC transporter substrate-binding protein n=1 Tax=Colwellia sp. 20A7 TaxID=2689569 RepID=UPI001F261C5E|nr:phosphate ABC transporter substrate-binding protein [Colwellia sp. 20A7]